MSSSRWPLQDGFASVVLLILAIVFTGCSSGPEDRSRGKRGARYEPPPPLSGQQAFFNDRIVAEVKIGAMTGFGRPGAGPGEEEGKADGPPRRPGGKRGMAMGGGMMSGGMGGPPPGGGPDGPGDRPQPGGLPRGAPSGPPVMIHLRFTNTGSDPVELHITDFLSPLGNFVVTPDKLTLAPGASAEVEPMGSGLASQIAGGDITLKLRIGGQRESRIVPLQVEVPPLPPVPKNGKTGQSL